MQLNNEKEMNSSTNPSALSSTSCSTSSTDSGVIIIDNTATFKLNKSNDSDDSDEAEFNKQNCNNSATAKAAATTTITTTVNSTKDKVNEETKTFAQQQQQDKLHNSSSSNNNNNSNQRSSINIENTLRISSDVEQPQSQQQQQPTQHNNNHVFTSTTSKNSSPTLSIRSTTISIISIDENADDSSVIETDSANETDTEGSQNNYVVKKLGQQTTYPPNSPDMPNIHSGLKVISQQIHPNGFATPLAPLVNGGVGGGGGGGGIVADNILTGNLPVATPNAPQIGRIELSNSTDVTFGDKHFYEGPVTIQQFLIDSRDKWQAGNGENGQDNPGYNPDGTAKNGAKMPDRTPQQQNENIIKRIITQKTIIITFAFILITLIVGTVIALSTDVFEKEVNKSKLGDGDDSRKNIPINSTIADSDWIFNGTLIMAEKDDWNGRPAKENLVKLKLPAHRVIISHTASENCENKHMCTYRMQIIQNFHMNSFNFADIGYNFVVGGDGIVYVGRGWDNMGAHTKGYNTDSIGIALIGTFTNLQPTPQQLKAAQLLIQEGVRLKKLVPDFKLYGARQLGATESPGEQLFKIIKRSPHWSEKI